jgi:anti-anti-sigma factor
MGRRDAVFEATARRIDDVPVVSLTGELDMATAPRLQEAVERAQGGSRVIVDLSELAFIDSSGIRALLQVYESGQDGHSTVSFIRGPDHVQRVLRIAGVEELLAWTEPLGERESGAI